MKLEVYGGNLNTRELLRTLNSILNKYNIIVDGFEISRTKRKQVISIGLRLKESVYYSPFRSQYYDRRKDEYFESSGYYLVDLKAKFGMKYTYLHYYHFALFNDTVAYIMENLKKKGYIKDWALKSAIITVKDINWRKDFPYEYLPQYDPAFLRPLETEFTYKGVKFPARRDKALRLIARLDKYFERGKLKPVDIPKIEDIILTVTSAKNYYKEIMSRGIRDTIWNEPPSVQAWVMYKIGTGERAEMIWNTMTKEEREKEKEELKKFLESVDADNPEFKKYLEAFKDKLTAIVNKYSEMVGSHAEEVLQDMDSAGFPFGLAKRLSKEPYIPPEIKEVNVERFVEKRREGISVSV